jgi:hypothetical protein
MLFLEQADFVLSLLGNDLSLRNLFDELFVLLLSGSDSLDFVDVLSFQNGVLDLIFRMFVSFNHKSFQEDVDLIHVVQLREVCFKLSVGVRLLNGITRENGCLRGIFACVQDGFTTCLLAENNEFSVHVDQLFLVIDLYFFDLLNSDACVSNRVFHWAQVWSLDFFPTLSSLLNLIINLFIWILSLRLHKSFCREH